MLSATHLNFLQEKIQDLRSALFFSMSDAVLKLPNSIITALKVDEVGQVWFFVNRPSQYLHEFDREFPARLDFFQKGKQYFIKIIGKARIVNDPEELNGLVDVPEEVKLQALHQMVLVKVKIQSADYSENKQEETSNWIKNMYSQVHKWFFKTQPGYRPFNFGHSALG